VGFANAIAVDLSQSSGVSQSGWRPMEFVYFQCGLLAALANQRLRGPANWSDVVVSAGAR